MSRQLNRDERRAQEQLKNHPERLLKGNWIKATKSGETRALGQRREISKTPEGKSIFLDLVQGLPQGVPGEVMRLPYMALRVETSRPEGGNDLSAECTPALVLWQDPKDALVWVSNQRAEARVRELTAALKAAVAMLNGIIDSSAAEVTEFDAAIEGGENFIKLMDGLAAQTAPPTVGKKTEDGNAYEVRVSVPEPAPEIDFNARLAAAASGAPRKVDEF